MKKLNRNEPCHCGSGKKYKNCHMEHEGEVTAKSKSLYIAGTIGLLILIILISLYWNQQTSTTEAPPGKVWSSEHGHWHDE